jgi:hypothetical protein
MSPASTTPLLVPSDDETPELIDEENGELLEDEDDYPDDIVAGLVIPLSRATWSISGNHGRLYPTFQGGYVTPWRGNPLPARVALHCESCMTAEGLLQSHWNHLIKDIHDPLVKYQTRRAWLLTGTALTVTLATPFLLPVILHSSSTRGASIVLFLALAGLLVAYQLLKCTTEEPLQLTMKDIVEHHTPGWKERLRIKLKLVQPKTTCGRGNQEMVLLFQKYVPVSERQAQIAFV